jgi:porin
LVAAQTHDDNVGFYVALEERLLSRGAGSDFDLAGSLRFGVANDDINPLSSFFGATLVATGLIADRPNDQLGVAVAMANAGRAYRTTIADAGGDPAHQEINFELTYYADVTEWLSVQPDLQWIVNPSADSAIDDALVAGLRVQVKNTWTVD